MDIMDFSQTLCNLNTAIHKYLGAKKARDYCRERTFTVPNDVLITIGDVLDGRIAQCEKQIIELATKITGRSEEKPDKKKK